jgi:mannonate dehydratase
MKLGFGFYKHMLNDEHYRFARQCGATHAVVHLVDYFNQGGGNTRTDQPLGDLHGWGYAGDPDQLWSVAELAAIKADLNRHGLEWAAVENFDPAHWHDILLDGPQKAAQLEKVKTILRRLGEVGIPIMGYNFSLAGVAGRVKGPFARGGAEAVGMAGPVDEPIPHGMVWNMVYDAAAPEGFLQPITHEQLWERFAYFLDAVLPTAEEAGVTLALHPDDPPLPTLRGQPRLVYQPRLYQRVVLDLHSRQGRVAYVHLRNVRGRVPHYQETFIDEGDVEVARVLGILHRNGYDGVVIPDHAPAMTCAAPWHAGMAFAMGYMKAKMESLARGG